jgi:hypothetical protein
MTRIVLHPNALPRRAEGPRALHGEWAWWHKRVQGTVTQTYQPNPTDIREAVITFEPEADLELVDPPVLRVAVQRRYRTPFDSPYDWSRRPRRFLDSSTTEVLIVWWGRPGPFWTQLPGTTCRPGEYEITELTGEQERDQNRAWADAYEGRWEVDMRRLVWPLTPARPRRRPLTVAQASDMLDLVSEQPRLNAERIAQYEARARERLAAQERARERREIARAFGVRELDLDETRGVGQVEHAAPELDFGDPAEPEPEPPPETPDQIIQQVAAQLDGFQPIGTLASDLGVVARMVDEAARGYADWLTELDLDPPSRGSFDDDPD